MKETEAGSGLLAAFCSGAASRDVTLRVWDMAMLAAIGSRFLECGGVKLLLTINEALLFSRFD